MTLKRNLQAIIMINFLLLFSCGQQAEEQQTESVKYVKVERVTDCQDRDKLVFNGKIKEKSLTTLSFRVGGPLVSLNVKTGDFVNAGDVIATIDKRDYKLQVQSTKAQFEQLKGEYGRYKELFEKNKIPANSFEKIESGYLMAKTAYENAENQLKDTELKAPVSGYIHEKMTENFQTVGPGQPIASIVDVSQLEVIVSVPEDQLIEIRDCDQNLLEVKNADIKNLPISRISIGEKAMADGLYQVKLGLNNNKNLNIFPGMSAEVTMFCKSETMTTSIPSGAVFYNGDKTYVWIFDAESKTINKREIVIENLASEGKIEINKGLNPDDFIVTAGVHSLHDQQKVQPIHRATETNIGGLL